MRRFSICVNKNLRQFKFKLLGFAYRFVVSNCKKLIAIFHMCHIMPIFWATQMLYGSCQVIIDQTAIFGIHLEGTFYLNMIIILYSDLQIFIPLTSLDNHYDAILLLGELRLLEVIWYPLTANIFESGPMTTPYFISKMMPPIVNFAGLLTLTENVLQKFNAIFVISAVEC